MALLARIAGAERVGAEPDAAAAIVDACGFLPLAVALTASRLRSRPAWSLAELAEQLRADHLDAFGTGERTLRRVFDLSYQGLSLPARRLFRLLGLHPGRDFTAPAAAALADVAVAEARQALELLHDEHLLQQKSTGRFELHDLIRAFATERLQEESPPERDAALDRLLAWYLHTADAAARVMTPQRRHAVDEPVAPGRARLAFSSFDQAQAWLDAEHRCLMDAVQAAADTDRHVYTAALPRAMWELFSFRGHWDDWIAACTLGLESARRHGDAAAEAWMLNDLGQALIRARRPADALGYLASAVDLRHAQDDARGEATALFNMGCAYFDLDRAGDAVPLMRRALGLHRSIGNRFGEGATLGALGELAVRLGDTENALQLQHEAVAVYREIGDRFNESVTFLNIGQILHRAGRLPEAASSIREAIDANQALGRRDIEARCWEALGEVHAQQGDKARAAAAFREAQALLLLDTDPVAEKRVAARLADLGVSS